MKYKIESGIPIPPPESGRDKGETALAMEKLKKGQSFLIPDGKIRSIRSMASKAGRALGVKFSSREVEGGVRVWRIA
jgi:hypothetical protein